MAVNGTYGTRIPSDVKIDDIEIYYTYRPTLSSSDDENLQYKKLSSSILAVARRETKNEEVDDILEGMYNLHLPLQYFNKKGFYNIYIKPKEIKAVIADVGSISSFPDVRGIVIDSSTIKAEDRYKFTTNNGLVGYRVVYINGDNGSREDYYRIVTSNNKCEPLTQSLSNANQKMISYRYNDSSSLTFLTLTPSVAPSFKSNATPFIGNVSQQVLFVNTKFEPVMIELEMVDHDEDTISNMLEGSSLRDLEHGLVTTYNENDEIYHQAEFFTLKDTYTQDPIFEVRHKQSEIDFGQTIADKL